MINKKLLEKLYRMNEKETKNFMLKELQTMYDNVLCRDGFVFAQGKFPVLLVSHLDTVHEERVTDIIYSKDGTVVTAKEGIGADDKNGCYAILQVIKRFNCSVLLCEQEEVGGVGANKFANSNLVKELDFNYIIEFDRMGSNDAVFYNCANDDFEEFITKDFYKTNYGTYSDICDVAPAIGCAAVNLSIGYYLAHQLSEYTVLPEMEESIEAACKILERTTENDKFEYIDAEDDYEDWGYANEYYEEKYYVIEYTAADGMTEWYDTIAVSREEAIGKFVIENPNVPYASVEDVWVDKESSKYL